jgi:2-methylisocitrate lyase-like PEP mutase family enzyme
MARHKGEEWYLRQSLQSMSVQTMTPQAEKARQFHELHRPGDPVILFNAWDAGSARTIAGAGAKVIATGSWSVAASHGIADGEDMPLDLVLANVARIARTVDVPVTLDFERGYGADPSEVKDSVRAAIAAGAIGFNIEDSTPDGLRSPSEQAGRLTAARMAGDDAGIPVFINARTDLFLKASPENHTLTLVDDALARMGVYAAAGANGLFVPGLKDTALIKALCDRSPWPVNVMVLPGWPDRPSLAAAGAARISHGPGPYRHVMAALEKAAAEAMED